MKHELKKLDKSQVEIIITVSPDEYTGDLTAAAARLSESSNVKGFRPGKAPYEIIKQTFGETKILEEALQTIVQKNFFKAVSEEKLETIGMPQIAIEKMAPNNDVVFKATVALMPEVTLANLEKIKVEKKPVEVTDKEVKDVLKNLSHLQAKENVKEGKATDQDKVMVDMEMSIDKVPVEGGQAKNHQIYLSEKYYIPGLENELIGAQKGDEKNFTLTFPAEHYQKHLAGKKVDFKVKIHDVYEIQYPEVDDEFAKSLGQESLDKLTDLLKHNLTHEAEHKEHQRQEQEILEKIIEGSKFTDIPEVIVTAEKQKMFYELKNDLERRGVDMESYLKNIKKTAEEIFQDFQEGALKRAQAALISRQIALENKIEVATEELEEEVKLISDMYKDNNEALENIKRPEVQENIAAAIQNRKVMSWLKEKILGEEPKEKGTKKTTKKTEEEHHHCEHC